MKYCSVTEFLSKMHKIRNVPTIFRYTYLINIAQFNALLYAHPDVRDKLSKENITK